MAAPQWHQEEKEAILNLFKDGREQFVRLGFEISARSIRNTRSRPCIEGVLGRTWCAISAPNGGHSDFTIYLVPSTTFTVSASKIIATLRKYEPVIPSDSASSSNAK